MMLNEITKAAGANKRRKRVGRGESSGHGKTCTRGHKGCQSRSGGGVRPLTEGGQMPIFRRLPKRGFSNAPFRQSWKIVNLSDLERFFADGETADVAALQRLGLVQGVKPMVKILGNGTLGKKLTVEAHAFSRRAREEVEKAGGTVKLIESRTPAEKAKAKRNTAKSRAAASSPKPVEKVVPEQPATTPEEQAREKPEEA
ncbi:MAG: 50S ribosomal protein L15 [Phycisphaerae bacterium]|nr:50S ribosomal protein L15 [Phycisphaerae bacterium]